MLGFKKKTIEDKLSSNKDNINNKQDKIVSNKEVSKYFKAIQDNENDRIVRALKSEKIAWKIAGGAGFLALIAVGSVMALAPLKTSVPFLVRVDKTTGYTDIVPQLKNGSISTDKILDQYWLSDFVLHRESYNWQSVQDDYNTIVLMANSTVSNDYKNYINNEKVSPLYVFKNERRIITEINGVTILNNHNAQVRFTKYVKDNQGVLDVAFKPTTFIATINFDYEPEKIKTVKERLINPLGFTVLSYNISQQA